MGSNHHPLDSPGSLIGDIRERNEEIDALHAKISAMSARLLPLFRDGETAQLVLVGGEKVVQLTRIGQAVVLAELGSIRRAEDLFWPLSKSDGQRSIFPAPGTVEDAEFGPSPVHSVFRALAANQDADGEPDESGKTPGHEAR